MPLLRSSRNNGTFFRKNLDREPPTVEAYSRTNTKKITRNLGRTTGGSSPPTNPDPYDSDVVFLQYGSSLVNLKGDYPASGTPPSLNYVGNCLTINGLAAISPIYNNNSPYNLGTGDFTIEAYFNSPSWYIGGSYYSAVLCAKRDSSISAKSFGLILYNGNIQLYYADASGAFQSLYWAFSPANSTNYYLRMVYSGGLISVAVNGVQIGTSQAFSLDLTTIYPFSICGDGSANSAGLTWNLQGLKITKGIARPLLQVPTMPTTNTSYLWF